MCTVASQTQADCGWCPETSCGWHPTNRREEQMGYDYKTERPNVFVLANQHRLMQLRDKAIELLTLSGALDVQVLTAGMDMPSSNLERRALIEYMTELELLRPIRPISIGGDASASWPQFYMTGPALLAAVKKARHAS
jgi:hypothetical protein